jgi:hypothetical protein
MKLLDGVRPGDYVLGILLTGLGVLLMVSNISGQEEGVRIDSTSWAMVPVFAVATLAVIWRRRSVLAVTLVAAAAMAVHVLAFGWVVRCGAGLPLAFALAYAAGRLCGRREGLVAFAATLGLQVLVLVQDSAAGLGIVPFTAVIGAAFWGVGYVLRDRSERRVEPGADSPVGSYV